MAGSAATDMDLTGRRALVTGANQGIGWAIAVRLAAHGARVAVNYPDAARRPIDLTALGPGAVAIEADIRGLDAIAGMFAEVDRRLGGIDLLVNNAGVFPRADVLTLDEATWDLVMDVNLKGAFFCAQAGARRMVATGTGGGIVNIASDSAFTPSARGAHYCASKAGLVALTKSLALGLAPSRIRVNAVAPGLTDTAQPRGGYSEAELTATAGRIPLGRLGEPDDVADAVLYLASDLARHVTGHTLLVTGGDFMGP